jgi:ATP-dependent RNA helicase DeaD
VAITLCDPREQRMLRYIENLTKQKIEIATLPTADALRTKRLEITRAALKDRLAAGNLGPTRAIVESLAQDFDMVDIAAAAVAMIHDGSEAATPAAAAAPPPPAEDVSSGPITVLFVGAGRTAGVRPGDLVGAITGEAKVTARQVGGIRIAATHSLVEVPAALADRIITALRATKIRGKSVDVKRAG